MDRRAVLWDFVKRVQPIKVFVFLFSPDQHFVDRHRAALIQRVSNVGPLLDGLLDKRVIQQEMYERILAVPTNQAKMRELYSALKAGPASKDIFYDCLVKREPYLIDDLKKV